MKQSGAATVLLVAILVPALTTAEPQPAEQARVAESGLPVGSWVRLEAPEVMAGRFTGRLVQSDPDELTVALADRLPVKVPRAAVTRAEVSLGRRKTVLPAALIGAGTGLLFGLILPLDDELCGRTACTRGEMVAMQTFGGAVTGALVGLVVKREDWRAVPTESLKVSVAPTRGRGVAVGVTLGF